MPSPPLEAELAAIEQQLDEMKEEQSGEEGLLAEVIEGEGDKQKITAKAIEGPPQGDRQNDRRRTPRNARPSKTTSPLARPGRPTPRPGSRPRRRTSKAKLDAKYPTLTEDEIKTLVVDDKWLATLAAAVQGELDRVSQTLTGRIRQLAERYATPLPQLTDEVATLAARVDEHLKKMGAVWK